MRISPSPFRDHESFQPLLVGTGMPDMQRYCMCEVPSSGGYIFETSVSLS
jgi:hypothetical protein